MPQMDLDCHVDKSIRMTYNKAIHNTMLSLFLYRGNYKQTEKGKRNRSEKTKKN